MRRERSAVVARLVLLVALASLLFAVGMPALGTRHCRRRGAAPLHTGGIRPQPRTCPTGHNQPTVRLTVGWLTGKGEAPLVPVATGRFG